MNAYAYSVTVKIT